MFNVRDICPCKMSRFKEMFPRILSFSLYLIVQIGGNGETRSQGKLLFKLEIQQQKQKFHHVEKTKSCKAKLTKFLVTVKFASTHSDPLNSQIATN